MGCSGRAGRDLARISMDCVRMGAIGAGLGRQGRGSPGWMRTMRPAAAFVLEGVYQDRVFACHGLLARALGDVFGMNDAPSIQVALILRESIQACPHDAKGATKAPQRSLIRCPVYTLGNGPGPSNPELPSPSSSKNSCPIYMLRTKQRWTQTFHSTNNENG